MTGNRLMTGHCLRISSSTENAVNIHRRSQNVVTDAGSQNNGEDEISLYNRRMEIRLHL